MQMLAEIKLRKEILEINKTIALLRAEEEKKLKELNDGFNKEITYDNFF